MEPVQVRLDDGSLSESLHHPDCDGYRMHSVRAKRTEHGTWVPECPLCGVLMVVGSMGTAEGAVSMGRGHSASEPCDGRCREWT